MVLDWYIYELKKSWISLKTICIILATASKNITIVRILNSFWLNTYPTFKTIRDQKTRSFQVDSFLLGLIYVCGYKENNSSHLFLILRVYEFFSRHINISRILCYALNLCKKNSRTRTKKQVLFRRIYFYGFDSYICYQKKKFASIINTFAQIYCTIFKYKEFIYSIWMHRFLGYIPHKWTWWHPENLHKETENCRIFCPLFVIRTYFRDKMFISPRRISYRVVP